MFAVPYLNPSSSNFRRHCAAIALAVGSFVVALPSLAGEASASFRVSIQLLSASAGAGTCTASAGPPAPQVTCRPTVVGGGTAGGDRPGGSPVLGYRIPESHVKLARLAGGELVEVGAENSYAWTEDDSFALGEYSSRLVMAGERSYLEMTVSW
jgi:hypothetical protein